MVVREWFRRRCVSWRRRRLLAAYARVFKIRHGKHAGFSPTVYALMEAEEDDLLELTEDGVVWYWPDDTAD